MSHKLGGGAPRPGALFFLILLVWCGRLFSLAQCAGEGGEGATRYPLPLDLTMSHKLGAGHRRRVPLSCIDGGMRPVFLARDAGAHRRDA